jgi:hypothetical protein
VAGHDGVILPLGHVLSVPLADAGTTSIGEDDATELPHGVGEAVPLGGGPDLLTAGCDIEGTLGLETLGQGLLHQRGHPAHVLVARVCAGTDKTVLDLFLAASNSWEIRKARSGVKGPLT